MQQIDRILDKALQGERIGLEECTTLFESDEIEKMGHVANQLMLRNIQTRLLHLSLAETLTIQIYATYTAVFVLFIVRQARQKAMYCQMRRY